MKAENIFKELPVDFQDKHIEMGGKNLSSVITIEDDEQATPGSSGVEIKTTPSGGHTSSTSGGETMKTAQLDEGRQTNAVKCAFCDSTFDNEAALYPHLKSYHYDLCYPCNDCRYGFQFLGRFDNRVLTRSFG